MLRNVKKLVTALHGAGPESMVYAVREACAVRNASSCTAPYLDFCQHTFNL